MFQCAIGVLALVLQCDFGGGSRNVYPQRLGRDSRAAYRGSPGYWGLRSNDAKKIALGLKAENPDRGKPMSYRSYSRRSRRSILPKINFVLLSVTAVLVTAVLVKQLNNNPAPANVDQAVNENVTQTSALPLAYEPPGYSAPWYVFVYDPEGSRGKMSHTAALAGFAMNHRRFTLTTHRLYGLDKTKALDYRLLRRLDAGEGNSLQLAIRVKTDDYLSARSQPWPMPAKCTISANVGAVQSLKETIFLNQDSDITLVTDPVQTVTESNAVEVSVSCGEQPEAVVRALTFDIDLKQQNQRYSRNEPPALFVPTPDRRPSSNHAVWRRGNAT